MTPTEGEGLTLCTKREYQAMVVLAARTVELWNLRLHLEVTGQSVVSHGKCLYLQS